MTSSGEAAAKTSSGEAAAKTSSGEAATKTSNVTADRRRRAEKLLRERDIDAALLTPGPDLRYFTGYAATALERLTCLILFADGEPAVLVPLLEQPAALASPIGATGLQVETWTETEDPAARVADLVRVALGRNPGRVAFGDHMPVRHAFELQAALGRPESVLAGQVVRELRMRKSPGEVEALRRAGQAIDRVHARVPEWLCPGRTEAAVGRDIAAAIIAEGHAQVDFVIVGSGPNSASPHHELSERVIEPGDPVVVDIGGTTAEGYCSDSTRTYVAGGEPDAEFRALYAVLAEAQAAACDAVRPGVTAESVDAAAREVIAAAGYGERFIHRTGHGIGTEVHEEPYIVAGNAMPLEPGMAFSIEPGIYLSGRYGARIEDIVACGKTGVDRLNVTDHELTIVGP